MMNGTGVWLIWPMKKWREMPYCRAVIHLEERTKGRQTGPTFFFPRWHLTAPACLKRKSLSVFVSRRKASFAGAQLRRRTQPCSVGIGCAPPAGLQPRGQRGAVQRQLAAGWPSAASGGGRLCAVFGQRLPPAAARPRGRKPAPGAGGGLQLRERRRPGSPDQPHCQCSPGK